MTGSSFLNINKKEKFVDPYIDQETGLLKNKIFAKTQDELDKYEIDLCKEVEMNLYTSFISDSFSSDWKSILEIHNSLFRNLYPFAGKIREVNISKGNHFAPVMFLERNLMNIWDEFDHSSKCIEDILEYYLDLNFIHPFREGNGRSARIMLNKLLIEHHDTLVDWTQIKYNEYLNIMINSFTQPEKSLIDFKILIENSFVPVSQITKDILSSSIHSSIQYEYSYAIDNLIDSNEKKHNV